ncbi:MAG: T9SS type A sorting domain-containing protein [Bacteroidota bacterium]
MRLALLLTFLLAAPATLAQPFTQQETFDLPTVTKATFLDLDGTGNLGLVISTEGNVFSPIENGQLTFYLYQQGQSGANTYSDPIVALDDVFNAIGGFDVADFVGNDGLVDAVLAGSPLGQVGFPLGAVVTYENQGFPFGGGLAEKQRLVEGLRDVRIARLVDLSGDGVLDVVSFYLDATNVGQAVYFPGDGTGSFGAAVAIAPPNALSNVRGADFADVDDDGDIDVVAGSTDVLLNNGDGTFAAPVRLDASLVGTQDVAFGDVTGDGIPDVVAAGQTNGVVAFYAGAGDGTFGPRQTVSTTETGVNNVSIGDADGDGDNDVATASAFGGNRFAVYLNEGGGTFGDAIVVATGTVPREVLLGDVDQDGDADLFTGDRGAPSGFFLNEAPAIAACGYTFDALALSSLTVLSTGGRVSFAFGFDNSENDADEAVDVWAVAETEAGVVLIRAPRTVTVSAGERSAARYSQRVSAGAADGEYTYTLFAGTFDAENPADSDVCGSVEFSITKGDTPTLGKAAPAPFAADWRDVTLSAEMPSEASLLAAEGEDILLAPNPTRGRTAFAFSLAEDAEVRLTLFDVQGREVAAVVDGPMTTGAHTVPVETASLPAGIYVWRLATGARVETGRLTVVR